jgi:hypothetical protein
MKRKWIPLGAAIFGLVLSQTSALASDANGNHETYVWVVGADGTPTDTAMAPDGSTITMKGRGTLTAGPGSMASGGGVFTTSGGVSGTWTATGVDGFVSYGPAGAGFPTGATGGEAKLRVTLSNGQEGTLTLICLLGSPPPSKMEGIQLILGSGVSGEYTMQDGGTTVFILVH